MKGLKSKQVGAFPGDIDDVPISSRLLLNFDGKQRICWSLDSLSI